MSILEEINQLKEMMKVHPELSDSLSKLISDLENKQHIVRYSNPINCEYSDELPFSINLEAIRELTYNHGDNSDFKKTAIEIIDILVNETMKHVDSCSDDVLSIMMGETMKASAILGQLNDFGDLNPPDFFKSHKIPGDVVTKALFGAMR